MEIHSFLHQITLLNSMTALILQKLFEPWIQNSLALKKTWLKKAINWQQCMPVQNTGNNTNVQ
jgi:hypothetical protein